uniref:Solute carrier family 2 member 6 n=1 Tax=Astyanax mexicanus TaxID=7994 RepID=A0A8B9JKV0_ASTMX
MSREHSERSPLLQNQPQKKIRNGWLFLAVFSAVLGNFNFGFSLVFPSPVIPQLQAGDDPRLRMDVHQVSWFGSIFTLGAAAGGLSAMLMNDRIGRKLSIMISAVPSTAGYLVMGAAQGFWMLLLGRFLTGIAAGITASSIPVGYFPGSSTTHFIVFIKMLCFRSCSIGLVIPWRWLAVAGEVPVLLMLILLCFMPNSPRYLITHGKRDEACGALKWLRGPNSDYMTELNQIERSVNSQVGIQWADLRSPFYYKPVLISVFMRFLQQMTGITPILVYLEPIFHKTAITLEPKYDAALVGAVRLLSVMIAASLMDKAGRKALLYTSAFLMYLAMLSMTMYTHTTPCDNNRNITVDASLQLTEGHGELTGSVPNSITLVPLISAMVIIFGYAMGWGPITWLLMSEILPLGARGVASGLCVMVSWITAFALTQLFMHAVDAYGLFVPFLFFCVVCVVNIIFTAVCVPETKGRTLEEIENYFRTGRSFTILDS